MASEKSSWIVLDIIQFLIDYIYNMLYSRKHITADQKTGKALNTQLYDQLTILIIHKDDYFHLHFCVYKAVKLW